MAPYGPKITSVGRVSSPAQTSLSLSFPGEPDDESSPFVSHNVQDDGSPMAPNECTPSFPEHPNPWLAKKLTEVERTRVSALL